MDAARFDWTAAFEADRRRLFALAYRMLGSAAEADDVLQEAWLRAHGSDEAPRSPRAWLTTIVTRLCLDHSNSARRRRETYVGPWLPEPIAGDAAPDEPPEAPPPDERVGTGESVSMAFLLLLETLSPLERATFLLREVFDYDFAEIGAALGRTEATCRQLFHRAKAHLAARRPRFQPASDEAPRLAASFLRATGAGDVAALEALLADDVVMTADANGKPGFARKPVSGAGKVARVLGSGARNAPPDLRAELATLNGETGLVIWSGDVVFCVFIFTVDQDRIRTVHVVASPDKLARLTAELRRATPSSTPA